MDYIVKEGDCVLSIAGDHGFFWQTLWDDPQNANLKALRKFPNVLFAGDVVYVRDKETKQESRPTEARHTFVKKGIPAMLRLQLLDRNQQPRAGLSYVLAIDGKPQNGTSDSSGWIVESMPPNSKQAVLTITDAGATETYTIGLGDVDPITEITGVQQRLKNLGYSAGAGGWGPAIRAFQKKFGFPETGDADDATRAKLKEVHGC